MVQTPAHLVWHRVSMLHLSGLGRGGFKGLHRGLEKNTGGTRQKADLAARIQMFYEVFMISVRWFPVLKHAKTGTTWIELKNLESCFLFGKWCFALYSNCHTWATHCGKTPGAFWSKFLVNLGERVHRIEWPCLWQHGVQKHIIHTRVLASWEAKSPRKILNWIIHERTSGPHAVLPVESWTILKLSCLHHFWWRLLNH